SLDPTLRGLRAAERFERSQEILSEALQEQFLCAGNSTLSAPAPSAVQAAQDVLACKGRPGSFSDAAESNLALAVQLWSQRPRACEAKANAALERIMAKLMHR